MENDHVCSACAPFCMIIATGAHKLHHVMPLYLPTLHERLSVDQTAIRKYKRPLLIKAKVKNHTQGYQCCV